MDSSTGTWAAVTGAMVAGFMASDAAGRRAGVWVFKSAASAAFVAMALASDPFRDAFSSCVAAGLVLGAVGDVLLIPHDKRAFLGGLVSFLLGHVLYVAAFIVHGVDATPAALALAALVAPLLLVARWLLPNVEPRMKAPVIAYMLVITAMVAMAAGAVARGASAWLAAAAVAFFLSDLSVARDRFVKKEFANRAWGVPLYYAAQVLFAAWLHG